MSAAYTSLPLIQSAYPRLEFSTQSIFHSVPQRHPRQASPPLLSSLLSPFTPLRVSLFLAAETNIVSQREKEATPFFLSLPRFQTFPSLFVPLFRAFEINIVPKRERSFPSLSLPFLPFFHALQTSFSSYHSLSSFLIS